MLLQSRACWNVAKVPLIACPDSIWNTMNFHAMDAFFGTETNAVMAPEGYKIISHDRT